MTRKLFLILTFSFLLTNIVYAEREEHYMPYPIVFVSGIRTKEVENKNERGSPSHTWPNTLIFKELKEYFVDGDGDYAPPKYDDKGSDNAGEVSHLEFLFFDARQDTLATNAGILRETIKNVLERYYKPDYTYTEPCSTPKVILVCHSLGGLIARYMLVNYVEMQDKVAAVFFLGVPQQGSPLAVIGYFLPKEILALRSDIETIEDIIDSEDMEQWKKEQCLNMITQEEEKITGNLRFMQWAEDDPSRGLYTSTRDQTDNDQLEAVLGKNFEETWGLPKVTEKGVIKAALIPDTSANTYRHTFKAYSNSGTFDILAGREALVRSVPENGPLTYDSTDPNVCELAGLGISLGKVQKVHAIVGNRYLALRNGLYFRANEYIGWKNFESTDYSCIRNGFWDNGDGVSNLASQSEIGEVHTIDATHASWGVLGISLLTGETDHPATPTIILQAIDDAPVIESVRFEKAASDYIIVKVKDYLLADIEIVELTNADLTEFRDPTTGTYKPYFKYPNKGFLTERDVTVPLYVDMSKKIHLMPGEFHAKLYESVKNGATYNIRMKNPAGRETTCQVVMPSQKDNGVHRYVSFSGGNMEGCQPVAPGPAFQQFRQNAIDEFFNSASSYSYPNVPRSANQPYYTTPIGGSAYSDLAAAASVNQPWPYTYPHYYWGIDADSNIAPLLNFDLAVSKAVKSAKLIGRFQFENYKGKKIGEEIIEEEKDIDFSISFLNDNVSFVLNTASRNSGDIFDIPIDPQYLNLNGDNTWNFSAGFLEDAALTQNCFPDNYIEPPIGNYNTPLIVTHILYNQEAFIGDPFLMITFEEETQN